MDNKVYFYDDEYYTLEEICEKYNKLAIDQKKQFRDALAHFTLTEIFRKCNYDERIRESVLELAKLEAIRINLYGSDCGRVLLVLESQYKRELRKLMNILSNKDNSKINKFINGELFLYNIIYLTIGSSFEKNIITDLCLIDYNFLSEEECFAISDNFIRDMKDEEIIPYKVQRILKKY